MARALIAFLALFFRRVALPCHVCLTTQRIPASLDRRASVIRIEHSAQVRGDAELYWHARRHRFAVEARRVGGRGGHAARSAPRSEHPSARRRCVVCLEYQVMDYPQLGRPHVWLACQAADMGLPLLPR
jgi:hypothetical protein